MTDRELIRRIQNGDREALGSLIERYYDDVYRFCLYLTANEADSCDISQEVFFRFIRRADRYQYKNLKGYLLITARNLCRDYLRKREREKRMEVPDDIVCEKKTLNELETKLFINEILQRVPLEQREVVLLRIREEMKFQEIADIQGCSLSTVKSRYRLGIERLRKEMADDEKKR